VNPSLEELEARADRLRDVALAIYEVCGTAATQVSGDRASVTLHSVARRFGALAQQWRGFAPHRADLVATPESALAPVVAAMATWVTADPTGRLVLVGLVSEVLPRYLVSLRDVAVLADPGSAPFAAVASRQAAVVVTDQQQLGLSLREEGPLDESLAGALASGAAELDGAGFGESFLTA